LIDDNLGIDAVNISTQVTAMKGLDGKASSGGSVSTGVAIGIAVGVVAFVAILIGVCICNAQSKKRR